MAKKRKPAQGTDIEWYLISIDRLKQIGLVVLIILLAGAGYWYFTTTKGNPRSNAESAIEEARQSLNRLAASKDFNLHRNEFDRAQRQLDQAKAFLAASKFPEAQNAAVESYQTSRGALAGERENDAQFLTVEGPVTYQKGGAGDWKNAEPRTALFNGDWVKTSSNASAELIFSNGSLYTIGSNALLEIFSQVSPGSTRKTNAVQMQVGSVEVATTDDQSTVRTPGSQVIVDSESTTQVGVDRGQATSVVATKGSASVSSKTGGQQIKLASGDKINASSGGDLGSVKKVIMSPALLSPGDNQVFQMTSDLRVAFNWNPQPNATAYVLQVSRSRLFSTLEINSKRERTTAGARVTDEGSFYWRVASVGPDGEIGPFSSFRRFRVAGGGGSSSVKGPTTGADNIPPTLQLNKPNPIGGPFFMIEGTTEPGSTVFINDEEVDVESNGHFKKLVSFNKTGANSVVVKAVDPAGNQTVKSETVFVEE